MDKIQVVTLYPSDNKVIVSRGLETDVSLSHKNYRQVSFASRMRLQKIANRLHLLGHTISVGPNSWTLVLLSPKLRGV